MDDEAPLPSEPILSEEETSRQIAGDFNKYYHLRIRQLEQELQQVKEELLGWKTNARALDTAFEPMKKELQQAREELAKLKKP